MTAALVAAGGVALAVHLALSPVATPPPYGGGRVGRDGESRRRVPLPVILAVLAAATAAALLDGTRLVAALVGAGCLAGAVRAVQRRRDDRARAARRARVVEVGEAMVGELRAGQPPLWALARAGEVWPDLAPVVAAARLGADVPGALREQARRPGAEGLADLAAAWQVSERSGAALASALAQVVASARARQHAAALVAGELASARATARLVALLPVGTMAMAAGIGAAPWRFLLDHPVGVGCLAAGATLVLVGLAWIDRIASKVVAR